MGDKRKQAAVIGAGVIAVLGSLYNILTLPELPDEEGLVGSIVRAVGGEFTEVLEWVGTTAFVNSVVLLVVGVGLILVGIDMWNE